MLACCGATKHQWEEHEVERRWVPTRLRCLIIGENPGSTASQYFYQRPPSYTSDTVVVRRALLRELHQHGIIPEATLEGFQSAGFLFDHAIRCQLSSQVISGERQRAMRYASSYVKEPVHLQPWIAQSVVIWVMGHLASNAVANATTEFPRQRRKISMPPYPSQIASSSRFFLSEYITWRNEAKVSKFCEAFVCFAREKHAFDNV
jgi:hypothetical protein